MRSGMRWQRRAAAAVCSVVMLLGGAVFALAKSDPFPVYDSIRPNVAFWKKIYSAYSTSQGVIHDSENLGLIYEVIELVDSQAPRAGRINRARIKGAKEKYERILKKLAGGRSPSSAEEKRVLALFGESPRPAVLRAAARNLRFQLGQKDRFRQGVIRSGAFLAEIKKIIQSYGLPEDLAYLPHVESSFNYEAYSKFGAAGIWQFTHSTGKRYMKVNYVVDERRDPIEATHAAARFLKQNYEQLQCWPSAITAYNHGPAGMQRALKSKGCYEEIFKEYNGGHFKFASRNFYSEFLAALEVAKDYRRYFGELKLAQPVRVSTVELAGYAPVAELAAYFREDMETIRRLNPALREPVFTGQKYVPKGYALRLPYREGPQLNKLVAGLSETVYEARQKRSRFYRVQRGDTASRIARAQSVTLRDLILANQLDSRATIYVGQNLRIPSADEIITLAARSYKREPVNPLPTTGEEVLRETGRQAMAELREEAVRADRERHDAVVAAAAVPEILPPAEPEAAELPTPEPAHSAPETEALPGPAAEAAPEAGEINLAVVVGNLSVERVVRRGGKKYGTIRVEAEETLGHYADWLGVPTQAIRRLNGFRYGQAIRINQEIKIPLDKIAKEDFEEKRYEYHKEIEEDFFAAYQSGEARVYQVKRGDNIWSLCRNEFEVPLWLVRKYNAGLDFNGLRPAQHILVPVVEKLSEFEG